MYLGSPGNCITFWEIYNEHSCFKGFDKSHREKSAQLQPTQGCLNSFDHSTPFCFMSSTLCGLLHDLALAVSQRALLASFSLWTRYSSHTDLLVMFNHHRGSFLPCVFCCPLCPRSSAARRSPWRLSFLFSSQLYVSFTVKPPLMKFWKGCFQHPWSWDSVFVLHLVLYEVLCLCSYTISSQQGELHESRNLAPPILITSSCPKKYYLSAHKMHAI